MPTITLKVTSEFKRQLTRVARERKLSIPEVVCAAVEKHFPPLTKILSPIKDHPVEGKGWLLGRLKQYSLGPSTYDPSKPAFDENEWEHLKQ